MNRRHFLAGVLAAPVVVVAAPLMPSPPLTLLDVCARDGAFYGDTASTDILWDQSCDALILEDSSYLRVDGTGSDVTLLWSGRPTS